MKFKVGDKVRLTREALSNRFPETKERMNYLLNGSSIVKIQGDFITLNGLHYSSYKSTSFELVPEEPEFEYGEEIEVWDWSSDKWYKRIFIYKIPGKVGIAYACVSKHKEGDFKSGKTFEVDLRKTVRKLRPQLTRKEIAEKFGVSEDFTLVDE